MKTALIVAMTAEGLMGRDNGLPWHYSEDLKHFKRMTKGHVVLMGRKTFESLLSSVGGPLPNRLNLVVSRSQVSRSSNGEMRQGARWFDSITHAAGWLTQNQDDIDTSEVFIIGGAKVFRLALRPHGPFSATVKSFAQYEGGGLFRHAGLPPDRIIVTWVPSQPAVDGDIFFPFKRPRQWLARYYDVAEKRQDESKSLTFVTYVRKHGAVRQSPRQGRGRAMHRKQGQQSGETTGESRPQRELFG